MKMKEDVCMYLWTIATRKNNNNKKERDAELNLVPHGPSNKQDAKIRGMRRVSLALAPPLVKKIVFLRIARQLDFYTYS